MTHQDISMHGEKKKRNDEIRKLFASGMNQTEIGKQFGIAQCRVSAIAHRLLPCYRYCNYCNGRIDKTRGDWGALCNHCRARRKVEKATRKKEIQQEKKERHKAAQRRLKEKIKARAERRAAYEKQLQEWKQKKEAEEKLKQERRAQLLFRKESMPVRLYEWQSQGRESVRYLVRYRDDFTCQDCGLKRTPEEVAAHNKDFPGKKKSLDVHHLGGLCGKNSRGYDKESSMALLVTLCHKCHFRRHDFSKRKEWDESKKVHAKEVQKV